MSRLEILRPRQATVWQRMVESLRSYWVAGQNIRDPLMGPIWDGQKTATGLSVNEYSAHNYSAVWAADNLISGDISSVPLVLYRRTDDGRGKERFTGHPLYRLLHDAPNPECTSMQFRRALQSWALRWGNGCAEIERDAGGRPKYLWPIEPERVSVFRTSAGGLRYRVFNPNGQDEIYLPSDMLHIRGLGDDTWGCGVISKARESVGLGLASERFGGALFGNGLTVGGTLTHPGRLSPEARENLRNSMQARHQGVQRAHQLMILEENMVYAPNSVSPDDAQFLETRQFQVTEIARWFNLPPHKLMDLTRATFSNIEQQSIDYNTTTLRPWFTVWEQELSAKLIAPSERSQQVIGHVVEALLRGDSQGRAAFYTSLFQIGAMTSNEIRAAENLNPLAGGDTAFVPLNMAPADKALEYVDAQIKQMTAKAESPAAPTSDAARDALILELTDKLTAAEARAAARDAELVAAVALHDVAIQAQRDATGQEVIAAQEEVTRTAKALAEARTECAASAESAAALTARVDALLIDVARAEQERATEADARADAERAAERAKEETERLRVFSSDFALRATANLETARQEAADAQARADAEAVSRQLESDARAEAERKAAAHLEEANLQSRYFDKVSAVLKDAQAELDTVKVLAADERARADAEAVARQQEADARAEADRVAKQAVDDAALIAEMRDKTTASLQAAQRELTDAMTRAQDAEARSGQLRDQVTLAESVLFTANTDHAAAVGTMRDALAALERERDDAKASAALLEARAVAAETEHRTVKQAELDRMAATIGAHRGLIVDALGRMVRRETAKARGQQATPQKLRRWLATFETVHGPLCVEALLPAIRTHLAWTRSDEDPQAVTADLVRTHIVAFIAAVTAAADSDPDEFPSVLEAVLQRWEANRPDAVADDILRKEIEHVRAARY